MITHSNADNLNSSYFQFRSECFLLIHCILYLTMEKLEWEKTCDYELNVQSRTKTEYSCVPQIRDGWWYGRRKTSSFTPRSIKEIIPQIFNYIPPNWRWKMRKNTFKEFTVWGSEFFERILSKNSLPHTLVHPELSPAPKIRIFHL